MTWGEGRKKGEISNSRSPSPGLGSPFVKLTEEPAPFELLQTPDRATPAPLRGTAGRAPSWTVRDKPRAGRKHPERSCSYRDRLTACTPLILKGPKPPAAPCQSKSRGRDHALRNMVGRARLVTFYELSYPLTTQLQLSGFCQHQFLHAQCFPRQAGCKRGHKGTGAQRERLSRGVTAQRELSVGALHAPSPTGQHQRGSGKDWKLKMAGMEMQVIRLELTPCNKS